MIPKKLKECLETNHIEYRTFRHSTPYVTSPSREQEHIPNPEFIKNFLLKIDGKMVMTVLPATRTLELEKLRKNLDAKQIELVGSSEVKTIFEDCEPGAVPPFGNLFGVNVIVAKSLTKNERISFNGGTHHDLVTLKYKDFEQLVHPKVVSCSFHPKTKMELAIHFLKYLENGKINKALKYLSSDCVFTRHMKEFISGEDWCQLYHSIHKAIPDLSFNVRDILEIKNGVQFTIQPTGTQTKELKLPDNFSHTIFKASGQKIKLPEEHLLITIEGRKITKINIPESGKEHGIVGIMTQLGYENPEFDFE